MIKFINRLFKHKTIVNCNREPYLTRWYLFRRPRIAFFLHLFIRSDEERALHDHPWSFITIILWRGYIEHTENIEVCECGSFDCKFSKLVKRARRKWPLMICWRPAEWRHRVELVKGKQAVTIVIRFKERREWGFWERTGFVQWNKWWQNNCE